MKINSTSKLRQLLRHRLRHHIILVLINNGSKKQPTKRVRIETSESEGEGPKDIPVHNNNNMQESVAELHQMQVTMQNMLTNLAKAFDKTPQ